MALPESVSLDLLAKEIGAVDGVAVEHVRSVGDERADSATAVLQLAADVAETRARAPAGRARRRACSSPSTPTGRSPCRTTS